jgi:hypothetical protein
MSIYKATSWGRTRRPKHMVEDVPASKQTAITVTTVAAGDLSDALTGTNAGENGYVTENQRFLHLQIENNDTAETIKIYGYNYAFGSWAQLYLPVGVKDSADTTAELAYVAATFSSISGKKMLTIPLRGVDRVAFVDDGTHDANLIVRAAMSTF